LVEYDENGKPKYPISISSAVKILDLGVIVYDKKAFHAKNYIWPFGFKSVRTYTSMKIPSKRANFFCEIIEQDDKPLFKVTPEEDPSCPVVADSASAAWSSIIQRINNKKIEDTKRMYHSVSGPEYFGYANPAVVKLIQELPNAEKCTKFVRKIFEPKSPKKKINTNNNNNTNNHNTVVYPSTGGKQPRKTLEMLRMVRDEKIFVDDEDISDQDEIPQEEDEQFSFEPQQQNNHINQLYSNEFFPNIFENLDVHNFQLDNNIFDNNRANNPNPINAINNINPNIILQNTNLFENPNTGRDNNHLK